MRTQCCLSISIETKLKAKELGINLSRSFEEFLNIDMNKKAKKMTKDDLIKDLKHKLAVTTSKLNEKISEIEKLKKDHKSKSGVFYTGRLKR